MSHSKPKDIFSPHAKLRRAEPPKVIPPFGNLIGNDGGIRFAGSCRQSAAHPAPDQVRGRLFSPHMRGEGSPAAIPIFHLANPPRLH